MASFDDWLDQVKEQAAHEFEYLADCYSFRQAWADGMEPSEAIADARDWLESE